MFTRVGSILKNSPKRSKSGDSFLALRVRQVTKEYIEKILEQYPEDLSTSTKVKSFRNGTISIVCSNLLAAEFHTRSEGLKKDINEALGKNIVEKIRFRRS